MANASARAVNCPCAGRSSWWGRRTSTAIPPTRRHGAGSSCRVRGRGEHGGAWGGVRGVTQAWRQGGGVVAAVVAAGTAGCAAGPAATPAAAGAWREVPAALLSLLLPLTPRMRRPQPNVASTAAGSEREAPAAALSLPQPPLPTSQPSRRRRPSCAHRRVRGVRRYGEGDWGATPQTLSPCSLKRRTA
jgi:hypothetical protein